MPTTPYAKLRVAVNFGAWQSGGLTAAAGNVLSFSLESTVGVEKQRYEIYSYPDGYACPAGWSTDVATGVYYTTAPTPPDVTLPAAPWWGKLLFRAKVGDANKPELVDETTGVSVPHSTGLKDIAFREGLHWGGALRSWVKDFQDNLRLIAAGGLGGGSATRYKEYELLVNLAGSLASVTDTVIKALPAQFQLQRVLVKVVTPPAGGTATIRLGSSTGAADVLLDQAVQTSTPANTTYGDDTAELGSSMAAAKGYEAYFISATTIRLRSTVSVGAITSGQVLVVLGGMDLT